MADETNETQADKEAAEKETAAFVTEQERLLALSHADDRPKTSVAALAPRNRPIDGEVRVVRAPEVRGDVETFDDPARGLEAEVPDVEHLRRTEGAAKGDAIAAAVVDGKGPETPAEVIEDEVPGPSVADRHTATEAEADDQAAKARKGRKTEG